MQISKKFQPKKVMTEQLDLPGLSYLGNAYGFDVYEVSQFEPLETIAVKEQTLPASQLWFSGREAFETAIQSHYRVSLFIDENTSEAAYVAVKDAGNRRGSVGIKLPSEAWVSIECNYTIQNSNRRNYIYDTALPLFLLPEFEYEGVEGLIFQNNKVVASYAGLINPQVGLPEAVEVPLNVEGISSNAFRYYPAQALDLTQNHFKQIDLLALNEYEGKILADYSGLKYREVGNEITILGIKPSFSLRQYILPSEINGKKVTKIAPFAFAEVNSINKLILPRTIEEIGKGAFLNMSAEIAYTKSNNIKIYADAFTGAFRTATYR